MSAEATTGRASSAPTLNSIEVDLDKCLSGIVSNEAPRSALKKVESGIEKFLEIGSEAATGSEGASMKRRWRTVRYSRTVGVIYVTPYSELYGAHPREFDFDSRGAMVKRDVASLPGPHAREILFRRKPECNNMLGNDARANMISAGFSNIHVAPSGISSMEEECEVMPHRSGVTVKHEQSRNPQAERDRQTMTHARNAAWAQVPTRPG